MTVTATTAQSGPFTPDGIVTAYPFTFVAASASEVQVVRRPSVGSDVILAGYTVSLGANGTGTVNFTVAPVAGDPIYVLSNPNFLQQVSFPTQGSWSPTTMNKALDRIAIRAIYLKNLISTAIVGTGGGGTGPKGDPGGNVLAIGLFSVAATLSIPGGTNIVKTSGYSADGRGAAHYVYDAAVDAAYVTANPRTSFISSNARGFKLSTDQRIWLTMFGAIADDNGTVGTDNLGAFTAALAWRNTLAIDNDGYVRGTGGLFLPAGRYYSSGSLDFTFGMIFEGEASPGIAPASQIRFAEGVSGLRIQYYVTAGETTTGVTPHSYGDHVIIRNIGLLGPVRGSYAGLSGGEAECHGILAKAPFVIENCLIQGFRGDGVHCDDDTGAGTGNINVSQITNLRVREVRNGVLFKSGDANACTTIAINGTYCRQHTIRDESFLGNTHIGCHSANAGLVPGVPASVVSYSGNRYYVKLGQAVGASTNAPSGTTASNTYWGYLSAGAVDTTLNIPAWISGVSVREGGGFFSNNANARNVFLGAYQEGGEATSQFVSPTLSLGGINTPDTTGNLINGSYARLFNDPLLGQARVESTSTTRTLGIHNSQTLSGGINASINFEQGLEADAVTPANLGAMTVSSSTNNPATAEGVMEFWTRTVGGTGGMTSRIKLDGSNFTWRPTTDNNMDSGLTSFRWKTGWFYAVDASTSVKIGGGTALTKAVVYTPTITPASVGAATVAEQTFSVPGLTTADKVTVNPPAIGNATGIAGARVSAADTLAIRFVNPTAGALTPTSGIYAVLAFRS